MCYINFDLVEPPGIEPERSSVNPNHKRPALAPRFQGNRLSTQLNSPFVLADYCLHEQQYNKFIILLSREKTLQYNKIMIILLKKKKLFDYKELNRNVMQHWADDMPMQKRERAKLDMRIDLLERVEDNLPPGLLHNTKCKHIMHLVVNGKVALRPMLCRGPLDVKNEFTFLLGATERDRKYVPRDAPLLAEQNRSDLVLNASNRCKHERFDNSDKNIV
jgi:hypothetical protein